jgi:hypothetical protein
MVSSNCKQGNMLDHNSVCKNIGIFFKLMVHFLRNLRSDIISDDFEQLIFLDICSV